MSNCTLLGSHCWGGATDGNRKLPQVSRSPQRSKPPVLVADPRPQHWLGEWRAYHQPRPRRWQDDSQVICSCSVETGVIPFCEWSLKVSTRLRFFLARDVLAKCSFCILLSSCLDTDVVVSRLLFGVNPRCLGTEVEGWDWHERSGRGTARDGGAIQLYLNYPLLYIRILFIYIYLYLLYIDIWVHYIYIIYIYSIFIYIYYIYI